MEDFLKEHNKLLPLINREIKGGRFVAFVSS